jgi:hypothetical protein
MRFFICPICKSELRNDLEIIHQHIKKKHYEIILDQYTITVINLPDNWIEKED